MQLAPLLNGEKVTGLSLRFMGVEAIMIFDPEQQLLPEMREEYTRRPSLLYFRHLQRSHQIVLSWPDRETHNGIRFDFAGRKPGRR